MGVILAFAVYWLVLFAVCYLVTSQGQDALYDEPPPGLGWRVTLGSLILAATLTYTRSNFATMFTDEIAKSVIQAILWFGVFTLIFRFHPWHALGIGLATMLIITGLATMAVDSMLTRTPTARYESRQIAPPVRRPLGGTPGNRAAATTQTPAR